MAQRGKAISVKVSRLKVIKALSSALDKVEKEYKAWKKAEEAYQKAEEKYRKDIAKIAISQYAKAENIRVNTRWNGVVNVDFDIPANLIALPQEPQRDSSVKCVNEYEYNSQADEISNAIRILEMSDEEIVSTSTYQAVARYL